MDAIHDYPSDSLTVVIINFRAFLFTNFVILSYILSICTTETEGEEEGSNTTVLVLVIIIISLLVALAVALSMMYKAKSAETTPSNGKQRAESGQEVKPGVKTSKNKHFSSTSGIGEGPGMVKTGEVHGGKKRNRRRNRSSSRPKAGVCSQIQLPKGRQESTKQDSTKETMPVKY